MIRRQYLAALVVVLASAGMAQAGIIANVISNPSPAPGLDSYTVQLQGTEGSTVSTISSFELTGVHQLWLSPLSATGDTPFTGEASAPPFGTAVWNTLDTHLLPTTGYNKSPNFLPLETNDATNPAAVSLAGPFPGFDAVAGIGNLRFTDSANSANDLAAGIAFLAPQPTVLDFLQVIVPTGGTAQLNMLVEDNNAIGFNLPITFGGVVDVDPLAIGLPADGSDISLQQAFRDGTGLLAGGIQVENGNPTSSVPIEIVSLSLTGDSHGLFGASFDGLNVDLTLDVDAARLLDRGTPVSANLLVETNGGNLSYTLSATVPEPSTIAMVGLAMVGLVGFARRK